MRNHNPVAVPQDRGIVSPARAGAELFLVSLLILFLELACIRWFPAHVLFLTFFTNTVLLACFLGMSVGCLAARRPTNYLRLTPFFLALALVAAHGVERARGSFERMVDVGRQVSPQMIFFGTEDHSSEQLWSPYYRIDYDRTGPHPRFIRVNLIGHQGMVSKSDPSLAYALPH